MINDYSARLIAYHSTDGIEFWLVGGESRLLSVWMMDQLVKAAL